jgi:hypothetical protein
VSVRHKPSVISVEKPLRGKFGNTGKFFKKLAFVGLALSCLKFNKCHTTTIKSIMLAI